MVARKDLEKKYALISVYNKNKLKYLCTNLNKNNFNFVSTGSTGSKIRELGFKCLEISKITGLFLCVSSEPGEVLHGLCLIQNRVFHLFRFSGQKKVSEEEEMNC